MNWALYAVAAYYILAGLAYVGQIGKPREPVTPADAVKVLIVVTAVVTTALITAWRMTA